MCAEGPCTYPAIPGQDIDINGSVWPGSDLERHRAETGLAAVTEGDTE